MRPGIFVSRTREKLGRTCDQIGRTLEPCTISQHSQALNAAGLGQPHPQGRAETFGGAGAQNIKGAHETRL